MKSARIASGSGKEASPVRRAYKPQAATANSNQKNSDLEDKKSEKSSTSGDDDAWFMQQRRKAKMSRPSTAAQTTAEAEKKRLEREALMVKLKK